MGKRTQIDLGAGAGVSLAAGMLRTPRPWGVGFPFPPEPRDPWGPQDLSYPESQPPYHTRLCLLHSPLASCSAVVQPAPSPRSAHVALDVGTPGNFKAPRGFCFPVASTHTRKMLDSSWDAAPGSWTAPQPAPCTLSHQPKGYPSQPASQGSISFKLSR